MRSCAWCGTEFSVDVKGKRYCSELCRELSIQDSEQRRKRQAQLERRRTSGKRCTVCGAVLSMYGEGETCSVCTSPKTLNNALKQLNKMVKS